MSSIPPLTRLEGGGVPTLQREHPCRSPSPPPVKAGSPLAPKALPHPSPDRNAVPPPAPYRW